MLKLMSDLIFKKGAVAKVCRKQTFTALFVSEDFKLEKTITR